MIGGQFFKSWKNRNLETLPICRAKLHAFQGAEYKKYYMQIGPLTMLFEKDALNFVGIIF